MSQRTRLVEVYINEAGQGQSREYYPLGSGLTVARASVHEHVAKLLQEAATKHEHISVFIRPVADLAPGLAVTKSK